ncbi:uncharacterized protein LOC106661505 [Cimex lectularius]|uniref:Ig-like domain-containing protein n=1 Tax=Cimex lectularius TaxID=79782 RepID=A0A8I6RB07_CIMLE|nr:uncharacterized protein LOC106661505 [Cimex lectularius]
MVNQLQAGCIVFVVLFVPSELGYNHIVPPWQHYYPRVINQWSFPKAGRPERVRSGHGRYRMLPRGAELTCDFPPTAHILSNIIWERADLGALRSLDEIYKSVGETREYSVLGRPKGSTLHLHNISPTDRGLYRCLATAVDPNRGRMHTLFQDVPFYPDFRQVSKRLQLHRSRQSCCRSNNLYKDYARQSSFLLKSSSLYLS